MLRAMLTSTSALCALAGCSESTAAAIQEPATEAPVAASWPIYRGDRGLQGVAPGSLARAFDLAWSFETGGAIASSPVVADGTVYVGSDDGSVYAIDLKTGNKRWSFATDDIIAAPPLAHGGRIYVGSSDFFFYALDAASGELAWKFETGDRILGGANWARGEDGATRIIVGSYDNYLYCFDAASGDTLWTYETDNYVNGTPAILAGKIVFGGCDAVLHVVDAVTGESQAQVELGHDCHVAGSVALAGDEVYLGHYGNEFVCVDIESGEFRWVYPSKRHPFFASPAIGADRIVFGGRDKKLHCVRRSTGEPLWTFPTRRKIDGSPVICGDKVVFGSGDGRLYLVDLATGKEIWNYEIGQSVFSSPAVVDGVILIGSNDGRLYAFQPRK